MRRICVLVLLGLAAGAAVWLAFPRGSEAPPGPSPTPQSEPPRAAEPAPTAVQPNRALALPADEEPAPPARALVVGRVLDGLGQPLAACTVAFTEHDSERPLVPTEGSSGQGAVQTLADGRFRLELAPHRPGVVTLAHPDFPLRIAAYRIAVPPGEKHDLGDLTLVSQPGLIVLVRARSGGAIAGAVVTASPVLQDIGLPTAVHGLAERMAITDRAGQAVLFGIAGGRPYRVRVEAPQCATREQQHLQPDNPQRAPELTFTLDGGHVIRGRVQVAGDPDLGRTVVRAEPVDGGPALDDVAGPSGHFRLAGAAPGRYRVRVESVRFGHAQVETEVPGGTLTIALDPGRSLRGVVRARTSGAPVAEATVEAEPEEGWPLVRAGETVRPTARTGADGVFSIVGLPAGRFTLRVTSHAFVATRFGPFAPDAGPVELMLPSGLRARGTLRCAGRPVSGAKVQAIAWEAEGSAFALWRAALTDEPKQTIAAADGSFELAGIPIAGQRLVVHGGDCAHWSSAPLRGTEGECLDLGTIALVPGATIEGVAKPHATVYLDGRSTAGLSFTAQADGDGRFAFRGLAAGDYEVYYHPAGRATTAEPAPKKPVTLGPGQHERVSLLH